MKVTSAISFALFTLAMLPAPSPLAAPLEPALVQQAYTLKLHGNPKAAIAILEPLTDSANTSEIEKGIVWNILGSSYQDLEMFQKSRQCYERSIKILRTASSARNQLASAIDNLGSVEEAMGQDEESERLRKSAEQIYLELQDHEGMTRISLNLANVALHRHDSHAVQRYLNAAHKEAAQATKLDSDDIAALLSIESNLALLNHDSQRALSKAQDAIEHWSRLHGTKSFLIGQVLLVSAEAHRQAGDRKSALSDMRQALDIFDVTPGNNSLTYLRATLQQAQIMREDGRIREADALQRNASAALKEKQEQTCAGCAVPIQAFR